MKILYFLVSIFVTGSLIAQATFNKRYHFDFLASVGTSVIPVEDGYYFTGVMVDTFPPYNDIGFFTKTDLEGNPVSFKVLQNNDFGIGPWFNTLTLLQDSSFALSAVYIGTEETTMFIRLDPNGDTLFTKKYNNPNFPSYTFMQPRGGMERLSDGGFVVCNWMDNNSDGTLSMDIHIFKINDLGEILWKKSFEHPKLDRPASLLVDNEGNTIAGWVSTDFNYILEDYTSQIRLVKLNPLGETLWEYTTPEFIGLRDAPNDMVLLDDGSLIIASGVGTEIDLGPSANKIWFEKLLFKLSAGGAIMWETVFTNPGPQNSQARLTNVIELSNESGFVTAGIEGEDVDGLYSFAVRGWLAKVDHEGQKLWERAYVGIETDNPRHEVFDLKECPDGGFILAGESKDGDLATLPPQQAWLLKLDQHGCLVPGCHLLDDVGEEVENPLQLAVYPNPTTDYLNFQLRSNQTLKNGQFRILSANGQVKESFQVDVRAQDTFVLPIWDWAVGVYFLQYLDEKGGVTLSEKFIKN